MPAVILLQVFVLQPSDVEVLPIAVALLVNKVVELVFSLHRDVRLADVHLPARIKWDGLVETTLV